jgi:hypothetical protein
MMYFSLDFGGGPACWNIQYGGKTKSRPACVHPQTEIRKVGFTALGDVVQVPKEDEVTAAGVIERIEVQLKLVCAFDKIETFGSPVEGTKMHQDIDIGGIGFRCPTEQIDGGAAIAACLRRISKEYECFDRVRQQFKGAPIAECSGDRMAI